MAITTVLPKEIWVKVFHQTEIDIKLLWKLSLVCKLFSEVFDKSDGWEMEAKKMLSDFAAEPTQGWKTWVKEPTPVTYTEGTIDLKNKRVTVNISDLSELGKGTIPFLEKIPGIIFCTFTKPWYRPREDAIWVWYRGECYPNLVYGYKGPLPLSFLHDIKRKEPNCQEFEVFVHFTKVKYQPIPLKELFSQN